MSDRERVEALAKVLADALNEDEWIAMSSWHRTVFISDAQRLLDSPAMRDLLAEAKAEALRPIQNLAMEHMNCTGCPTPWWLKQELSKEADR